MKKLLAFLVLLALPAGAITLTQARDAANAVLVPYWTGTIVPAQTAYFAAHGRPFQCVTSGNIPATVAADAVVAEIVGDRWDEQLHDQVELCSDLLPEFTLPKPFVLVIDTHYDRYHGWAYTASAWIRFDGTIYWRTQHYVFADSGALAECSPTCTGWPELQHNWQVYTPGE